MKQLFLILAIFITLISIAALIIYLPTENQPYIGVAFCGNTTQQALQLIDKVQNYTNLFILQSGPISKNQTATTQICDYAVNKGLNIIVFFGWFDTDYPWQLPWLDVAKQQYGDKFLGVYYYDEPGGIQVDYDWPHYFDYLRYYYENTSLYQTHTQILAEFKNGTFPKNYTQAATVYIHTLKTDSGLQELKNRKIPSITSEYALHWFDYLGGFDILLSQLGWNTSSAQSIALARGAARIQEKSWGVMITWTYDNPPYLSSGEEIYEQMVDAYKAGAQIISIFNYPQIEDNPFGILKEEHFQALELFWNNYIQQKPESWGSLKAQVALVLPKDYGWGMRSPTDRIWYWNSDEQSQQIWNIFQDLLLEYDLELDIIYDDPIFSLDDKYQTLYYWNITS
ncbi:MAG: hypothetical protein NWF10_03235 [Candidatus Bathyarchaeota archaeon]|nr:hypothetical protein [Candidatus Bathyarchaeota archaeon]